jgi:hypothetical protein
MKRNLVLAAVVAAVVFCEPGAQAKAKPSLSLRSSARTAFTPARLVLTGELRNVTSEDQEFYCPEVEWDWGDDTRSTGTANCDPYEPGVSKVKTTFVLQHTFTTAGHYKVRLTLKKGSRTLLSATTDVTIRGLEDVYGMARAATSTPLAPPSLP